MALPATRPPPAHRGDLYRLAHMGLFGDLPHDRVTVMNQQPSQMLDYGGSLTVCNVGGGKPLPTHRFTRRICYLKHSFVRRYCVGWRVK